MTHVSDHGQSAPRGRGTAPYVGQATGLADTRQMDDPDNLLLVEGKFAVAKMSSDHSAGTTSSGRFYSMPSRKSLNIHKELWK